jgi:toxin HigB-1
MIQTFSCRKTERVFNREVVKEFANIASPARRRLFTLNNARALADLLIPPGNRLEALQGDREGQHSIRINDQYRVCFTWKEDGPHDVEITKHYR